MIRNLLISACIILLVSEIAGCAKEYSYEGGPVPVIDSASPPDTIQPLKFPLCLACSNVNSTRLMQWNFSYDTYVLCGNITNAVISTDRTAFTFFGPSTCSVDTGIVMTVYLTGNILDRDRLNITTREVFFKYYDNTRRTDIFLSRKEEFSLTIDTYEHATGIATGKFGGKVNRENSRVEAVNAGKFVIQFAR